METREKHETTAPPASGGFNVEAARQKLAGKGGRKYWRTLDEVAETPEFQKWVEDEFPNRSSIMQIDRRTLLKYMGASMALAGLTGCRGVFLPEDKVVPFVRQPEEMVPGKPLFYASAMTLAGYATGVLVEQDEGRPMKIEGNPEHPASKGAVDPLSQAEILNFYDPDRTGAVLYRTNLGYDADVSTWELFETELAAMLAAQKAKGGAGIRILTGGTTSPTMAGLVAEFLKAYPSAKWHSYEPIGRTNTRAGAALAFGSVVEPIYDFTKVKVVLSLDGDFLSPVDNPGSLRYAREFANGRRVKGFTGEMNRLYSIESTPGLTGAMADHRWAVKASEVYDHALAIAAALGVAGATASGKTQVTAEDIAAIVKDLQAGGAGSLVVTGENQPPAVHALVHAINDKLGNVGSTVKYVQSPDYSVRSKANDLGSLVQDLSANLVEQLLIIGGNPVYDAPADFGFAEALGKAKTKIRLGLHDDETSLLCEWHLPMAHNLEAWGDARAYDGTLSVIQPLMAPLYDGRSAIEVLSLYIGKPQGGYDLVRNHWKAAGLIQGDFEKGWRKAVHDGLVAGSAFPTSTPAVNLSPDATAASKPTSGIEVMFRADSALYDGRYTNNGWLMELPRPLTKLTWDNAAIMSPRQAKELGIDRQDSGTIVKLTLRGQTLNAPVFIQPGHPYGAITLHLGYGRRRGGVVCAVVEEVGHGGNQLETVVTSENDGMGGGGFDAYKFRTVSAPYFEGGLTVEILQQNAYDIATTQGHQPLDGDHVKQFKTDTREVVVEHDLEDFLKNGKKEYEERLEEYKHLNNQSLYPEEIFVYEGPQWGMTIDLNTCIGCNACVTACQAENNIPVVGKTAVARHREMHWIRIDRYYSGDDENPQTAWQPVMCVHCEKAPCEPVCPVAATVHSHEGLNQMVYNRCVGTRYCSNNCPYKVRRFNYLNFTDNQKQFDSKLDDKPRIPLLKMLNNPNVTVRGRGVMEKCTYCVQRINEVRIESKKQNREIKDGEIVTACQQACPTQTIVFGNVADKNSAVTQLREDPRAYLLLEELMTRPRTSHLAKLRNPNPEIRGSQTAVVAEGA